MQVRTIAGHELTPGKTVKDHIHVEGTELRVPHVLLCGEQPGPTVLISAGIHNAEYVGIQAAIELSNELDVSQLRGNVILLPLANRSGFENRTMSMVYEDGKNLNRVFPGDRDGSEADKKQERVGRLQEETAVVGVVVIQTLAGGFDQAVAAYHDPCYLRGKAKTGNQMNTILNPPTETHVQRENDSRQSCGQEQKRHLERYLRARESAQVCII